MACDDSAYTRVRQVWAQIQAELFASRTLQGFISAGIVQYQHFTSVSHPSGKPQLYAYDQ